MVCIKNPDDTETVNSTFAEFIKSDDDKELRLVNIVIDEDFKEKGIGSQVVVALVNHCKESKLFFVVEGAYQPMS